MVLSIEKFLFNLSGIKLKRFIQTLLLIIIPISTLGQVLDEYFVTCNPDSFKHIIDNPYEDYYIPITFMYQNKTWTKVRLRIRGDSAREYPKKSFKIKFAGERFSNGREEINLNADYLDKSYLHSILASRLMRESGQPCFEAEPTKLFINDHFYGLYICIENVDENFLLAHGLDSDGNLYKAAIDGASLSVYDEIDYHWEKKTNKNSDSEDLEDLIQQLNRVTDSNYYNFALHYFDYEKMINIIAMNMLLANGSTYYHNYYLFHDFNFTNKWIMFPWDLDLTFNLYGVNYPYHRSSGYGVSDNPFLERALLCEPIFDDIQHRIEELADTIFNSDYLFPIIDSLVISLVSSILQDTLDDVATSVVWNQVIEDDKNFIANRFNSLQYQFENYPTSFRIERATDIFSDSVTLTWHPSTDPNGDKVTYILKYSDRKYFLAPYTNTFRGITDTIFTLLKLPESGEYFWLVTATDGYNEIDGFDKWNKFMVYSDYSDLVIFNEINYNSAIDFDPGDWLELYNPHSFEIDLSKWIFKDGEEIHSFTFPDYTIIKPNGFLVLCKNRTKFQSFFPDVTNISGDFDFGLSGDGELIRLFDKNDKLIDSLTYDDQPPWPIEPDGTGSTLELINPSLNNSFVANWAASVKYGTPGKQNSIFSSIFRDIAQTPCFNLNQNYPNPFNLTTKIVFNLPMPGDVELIIYNITGQQVKKINQACEHAGSHTFEWDAKEISSGIYFYQVKIGAYYSQIKKAVLIK